MKFSKLVVLLSLILAVWLAVAASATAGEIKIALDCPPDPDKCGTYLWSKTFGEYLKSQGLKVKLYPRDALGGEAEKLDQVSQNLLEISNSDLAKAGSLDPTIFGFRLPFLIDDIDHLYRIIENTEVMERINAGTTQKRVRVLAIVPLGPFTGIATTKKLIKTPEDFKGVRMRALDRAQAKWLELWGANAVIIPWSEIYNSLQTGVCDGYMNPAFVPIMFKHTEVLKYYSDIKLAPSLRVALASEEWYQGLSKKDRGIVGAAVKEADKAVHAWANEADKGALDQLRAAGLEVYVNTPAEREMFAKLIRPNYDRIVEPEVAELFMKLAAGQKREK
jgi:TRAP-type C4-dicarboxylate transport system substrate-binding protein